MSILHWIETQNCCHKIVRHSRCLFNLKEHSLNETLHLFHKYLKYLHRSIYNCDLCVKQWGIGVYEYFINFSQPFWLLLLSVFVVYSLASFVPHFLGYICGRAKPPNMNWAFNIFTNVLCQIWSIQTVELSIRFLIELQHTSIV